MCRLCSQPSLGGPKWTVQPAYVVGGKCVLRYDNERGTGDYRHAEAAQEPYNFSTPDQLMADFESDVARWNHEHGRS